ncbi:hypothetical protein BTA51_10890 [Hahella sp. CCB-MM4]|uniref:tetratricopeptide repeat protein n=1 Tax=Hahella sp. (strain CCB-MM4) TaxID=1926491 RepID=UPI000B9B2CFF|nr:tetratricopeptide repeat protein [Hahella sp. CCB-MM4]OZG73514.1 hypothetical protein BTA51_10890 [Hahella sp. CCB-MM4]
MFSSSLSRLRTGLAFLAMAFSALRTAGRVSALRLTVAFVILMATASQVFADAAADELLHREALYHFYNNDYLKTLVLLENSHVGSNHIDNEYHNLNHILALETNLRFGMASTVDEILQHLEFTAREKDVKQTVLMFKGRKAYSQGRWREAANLYADALKGRTLTKPEKDEALYYLANSYLKVNQVNEAAKVLGAISDGSLWAAYGYYNLGVYYARKDPDHSRAFVSLRVASAMTDETLEGLELNDRIQLSAGHIALEEQDYNKALSFLKNVRAAGTSAPAAIYDYGRAFAGLGRYRTAIQSWHRAKKFALVIPGVADTFQAIAYGYEQENLRATAIDAYLEAIAVYEKELRQLDSITNSLNTQGALQTLVEIKRQNNGVEWFLATDLVTNTPTVAFVNFMMEDPEFYGLAKEALQLNSLQGAVEDGLHQLTVFKKMLTRRAKEIGGAAAKGQKKLDTRMLNALVDERNELAKSLAEAEKKQDYQAFSLPEYANAGKKLEQLQAEMQSLSGQLSERERQDYEQRIQRLKGLVLWNSVDEYKQNRVDVVTTMQSVDDQLNQLKENFLRLKDDFGRGHGLFQSKIERVQKLTSLYSDLRQDLDIELKELDNELTRQGVELLKQHRDQIDSYYVRSQLALVNLYDDLALADLEKSKAKSDKGEAPL